MLSLARIARSLERLVALREASLQKDSEQWEEMKRLNAFFEEALSNQRKMLGANKEAIANHQAHVARCEAWHHRVIKHVGVPPDPSDTVQ